MLFKRKILVIYNSDSCQDSKILKDNQAFYQEEEIRGSIKEVAYKIGNILEKKTKSKPIYLMVDNAKQLKKFLIKNNNIDLVFNLCEAKFGLPHYESKIVEILEDSQIPFTGNTSEALKLTIDKGHFNNLLRENRLPFIQSFVFEKKSSYEKWLRNDFKIQFPCIVKLNSEDSSLGINQKSVVNNVSELTTRVTAMLRQYKQPVLVQNFINGREIHVAYHGHNPPRILGLSELDFSNLPKEHHHIYTYAAKWDSESEDYRETYMCESQIEEDVQKIVKETALKIIKLFRFDGHGRLDFRFSKDGIAYLIDANPNCNISDNSCFAVLAERTHQSYDDMIVDLCWKAYDSKIKIKNDSLLKDLAFLDILFSSNSKLNSAREAY